MILTWLADLLYPPRCVICREFLPTSREKLCSACAKAALESASQTVRGRFFDLCAARFSYEEPIRGAIHRFKFGGCSHYAGLFGAFIAAACRDKLDGDFDCVTWVPVSPKRRRRRGYDQAQLLGLAAARNLGIPSAPLLKKIRNNPAQSHMVGADARRANVAGVYVPVAGAKIAGQRILVIDDIITTGATLSECSRVLATAGAEKVSCATLAATPLGS